MEYADNISDLIASLDQDPEDIVRVSFPVYARGPSRAVMEKILLEAMALKIEVSTAGSVHRIWRSLYSIKLKGRAADIKTVMQRLHRELR